MEIKIKLFAVLREIAGWDESMMTIPDEISCSDILVSLQNQIPAISSILESCVIAINGTYADKNVLVSVGDELAILPPVSGG